MPSGAGSSLASEAAAVSGGAAMEEGSRFWIRNQAATAPANVTTAPINGNPARQISLAHRKELTAVPAVKTALHALTTGHDWY